MTDTLDSPQQGGHFNQDKNRSCEAHTIQGPHMQVIQNVQCTFLMLMYVLSSLSAQAVIWRESRLKAQYMLPEKALCDWWKTNPP